MNNEQNAVMEYTLRQDYLKARDEAVRQGLEYAGRQIAKLTEAVKQPARPDIHELQVEVLESFKRVREMWLELSQANNQGGNV